VYVADDESSAYVADEESSRGVRFEESSRADGGGGGTKSVDPKFVLPVE